MKNYLLIICSLGFLGTLNAQDLQSDHQWSFGLEIFPNSTYEIITNKNGGLTEAEQFIQSTEKPKFSMSGMAYVSYKLNRKSFLAIGIGYQNTGYKTTKLPVNDGVEIDPRIGFTTINVGDPNYPTDIEITHNHHSLQIPLFYKFNFTKQFFVRAGVSYLINLDNNSNADLYFESGEKQRKDYSFGETEYRDMNLSGNLGVGYTFYKSHTTNLYVLLNIERFFFNISTDGDTERTPISTGLILGARF